MLSRLEWRAAGDTRLEEHFQVDEQRVLDTFLRIQQLGVRIVFDDFGTGYASLSYLKKFPLDGLKIDRSFVFDLLTDPDDAAIVSSTVGLSKQLGLSVIAEGIEEPAELEVLGNLGVCWAQGFLLARPAFTFQIPDDPASAAAATPAAS